MLNTMNCVPQQTFFPAAILPRNSRFDTGVAKKINWGSFPFGSNRVRVLHLYVMAHWKGWTALKGDQI